MLGIPTIFMMVFFVLPHDVQYASETLYLESAELSFLSGRSHCRSGGYSQSKFYKPRSWCTLSICHWSSEFEVHKVMYNV